MREEVPAEDLIEDEAHVVHLEEDVVALEDFLQVGVAELSDEVEVVEVVDGLSARQHDFKHADDVGVLAVLEQHDLSQDAAGLGQRLEQVDNLFDGHVGAVRFSRGLGDVTVAALPDDLLHFVLVIEVLHREDFVHVVRNRLAPHHLLLRLHNYYTTNSASPK